MKKKITHIIFLIPACVLIFVCSCSNDVKKIQEVIDRNSLNAEKADSVTIIYSKEGEVKAKLFTPLFIHSITNNPPYTEMKQGLEVIFYDNEMLQQSKLTAKYGKYFEENNNMLVRDSVRIENKKHEILETEELIWNNKLQKFYTEKYVKISSPIQIIYGDGIEANQNFTEYKITNIRGIIGIHKNTIPYTN